MNNDKKFGVVITTIFLVACLIPALARISTKSSQVEDVELLDSEEATH